MQGVKIVFSKVAQNVGMMSEASQKMHRNDYNEDKYYIHDNGYKNTLTLLTLLSWLKDKSVLYTTEWFAMRLP